MFFFSPAVALPGVEVVLPDPRPPGGEVELLGSAPPSGAVELGYFHRKLNFDGQSLFFGFFC